jgi:hypothetical protein
MTSIFETFIRRQRGDGAVIVRCREPFTTKVLAAVWSVHSQLTVNLSRCISDGITDMKNKTSLQVFKTTMKCRFVRRGECRYANGLGILELNGKTYELKTERRIGFSQHES